MSQSNFRPRYGGDLQSPILNPFWLLTDGDVLLLAQNNKYLALFQSLIANLAVPAGGITLAQAQVQILGATIPFTAVSVLAYQAGATVAQWTNGTPDGSVTDYFASYNAALALAKSQGWA